MTNYLSENMKKLGILYNGKMPNDFYNNYYKDTNQVTMLFFLDSRG